MRKVNLPKACKVFRMQSEKVSEVMTSAKIRTSRRMLFRDKIYF